MNMFGRLRRAAGYCLGVAGTVLVGMAGVVIIRTWTMESRQISAPPAPKINLDENAIAQRFSQALRFKTISYYDASKFPVNEFKALHDFLKQAYPLLHSHLDLDLVGDHSLHYTWHGTDASEAPILLMAHQDVVPVEAPGKWEFPPFSGQISNGYVSGRGALDNKNTMIVICEAVEILLSEGFTPRRTVHLFFGHDEEIGGNQGASLIAQQFKERGIKPALVIDEGGFVIQGARTGPLGDMPCAFVGIGQKGAANIELTASTNGPAHSSMPPAQTPVGRLAAAIHRLETNQRPARITYPVAQMLEFLGPEMPFFKRIPVANRWLFDPILRSQLLKSPSGAAFVRTTTAPTMFSGSSKEQVIAREARAVVNFRILGGESIQSTVDHVRHTIADDSIAIRHYASREPCEPSATDTAGFDLLHLTIEETFPDVAVTPYLFGGGTDSRYLRPLTDSIYLFSPNRITMEETALIHGRDEKLSIDNLTTGVSFFVRLIQNSSKEE